MPVENLPPAIESSTAFRTSGSFGSKERPNPPRSSDAAPPFKATA